MKSDNLIRVTDLSATEAARRFSEMLDAVEHRGESFTILRKGRPVARISPAVGVKGDAVKRLLQRHRVDRAWAAELRELRALLTAEERAWKG